MHKGKTKEPRGGRGGTSNTRNNRGVKSIGNDDVRKEAVSHQNEENLVTLSQEKKKNNFEKRASEGIGRAK